MDESDSEGAGARRERVGLTVRWVEDEAGVEL